MTGSTDDGALDRAMILMRGINKQPKVFSKWVDLKEKFEVLGWSDGAPAKEPLVFITDVLRMINEAFDNEDRQPALIG